jgi:hypothetical protein
MGRISLLLTAHRVSYVARIYSGMPLINNEQWSSLNPGESENYHLAHIEFNRKEIIGVLNI